MELLMGLLVLGMSLVVALVLPVVSFLRASRADREARRLALDLAALRREVEGLRAAAAEPRPTRTADDEAWRATVQALQTAAQPPSLDPAVAPPPPSATPDPFVDTPPTTDATALPPAFDDAPSPVRSDAPPAAAGPASPLPPGPVPPLPGAAPGGAAAPASTTSAETLEQRIGARWLLYAGMGALILGLSYFVKFAFDNGWISEPLRVAVGLAAGAALIVTGLRFARRDLRLFGHVLAGGGIVVLYVALYAALHLYALIGDGTAFVAMVLVTALSAALAHRERAQALAQLALVGGFATPALIGGDGSQLVLFTYVAILVAGTSVLALRHAWPALHAVAYGLTVLTVLIWAGAAYTSSAWLRTELFLTLYLAMFASVIVALQRHARGDLVSRGVQAVLLTAPFVYHVASVAVLGTHPGALLVYFVLVTVAGLSVTHHTGTPWMRSILLLLVALPLMAWMTGLRRPGWYPGAIVTACAIYGLHLAGQWRAVSDEDAPLDAPLAEVVHTHLNGLFLPAALYLFLETRAAWWNPPMLAGLALWNAAIASVTRGRLVTLPWQFAAVAATLAAVAIGVWFDGPAVVIGWAMEAAALGWLAVRRESQWLGLGSAALFVIAALRLIDVLGTPLPLASWPIVNTRTLAAAVVIGAAAWVARVLGRDPAGEPPARTILVLGAHVLAIAWVSAEIHAIFGQRAYAASAADRPVGVARAELLEQVALSVAWGVYAVGLIAAGMARRYAPVRYLGIALFGLTILKVLLRDIAELDRVYQMLSVLGVGALLLLASYLYQRMASSAADAVDDGVRTPPAPPADGMAERLE